MPRKRLQATTHTDIILTSTTHTNIILTRTTRTDTVLIGTIHTGTTLTNMLAAAAAGVAGASKLFRQSPDVMVWL